MTDEKQTIKFKEGVLGSVEKITAEKNYIVSTELIGQPMTESGAVARVCCKGCGYCLEILENGAKYLAEMAEARTPSLWEGYYFETTRCIVCSDNYEGVKLKKTF